MSRQSRLFYAAANDVKLTFEGLFVHSFAVRYQDLFDFGTGRVGLFAQALDLYRHMSPAVNIIAHAQNFGFDDCPACLLRPKIGSGQKYLTDGDQLIPVRGVTRPLNLIIEKADRDLHMNARAITRFAIRIDSPAVPDCLERLNPVFHNGAAGGAVYCNDEAHAAGRMLFCFGIQSILGHVLALGLRVAGPFCVIFGHWLVPFLISTPRACALQSSSPGKPRNSGAPRWVNKITALFASMRAGACSFCFHCIPDARFC